MENQKQIEVDKPCGELDCEVRACQDLLDTQETEIIQTSSQTHTKHKSTSPLHVPTNPQNNYLSPLKPSQDPTWTYNQTPQTNTPIT